MLMLFKRSQALKSLTSFLYFLNEQQATILRLFAHREVLARRLRCNFQLQSSVIYYKFIFNNYHQSSKHYA